MLMKNNREALILELLAAENRLEVSVLADKAGVSQVTMRKDLDKLEQRGLIAREHGYAVLRNANDVRSRIAYGYDEKLLIAEAAAALVSDGDTLMIESGSCCALLADYLARNRKELTIITNSAFIASYLRGKCTFQVILLGGVYQLDSQVMVGPLVRLCADEFYVPRYFIGVDGYSEGIGFTNQDHLRAQAVRDMARQAGEVIVLTQSEKFLHRGVVPLNLPQKRAPQPAFVVTDEGVPAGVRETLTARGTQFIVAARS